MSIEVKLPQFGMGMQDASIIAWYRKEGEAVMIDEPLLEIETAKTTVEVPSPATGVVVRILVQVGENVPVMAVLAVIDETGAAETPASALTKGNAAPPVPHASVAAATGLNGVTTLPRATPLAARLAQEHGIPLASAPASGFGGRVNASDVRSVLAKSEPTATPAITPQRVQVEPRARKLAQDSKLPLESVIGSGPGGRVLESDIQRALVTREASRASHNRAPDAATTSQLRPASARNGMRNIIASRMMQSLHGSAQLTLTSEIDVTSLVRLREFLKAEFEVSYTGLFVKACGLALRQHPQLNASWTDDGVRAHTEVNVGVAVALDEGLIVPVIHGVQSKGLRQVALDFAEIVQRARNGSVGSEELTGGTFSISNLGTWGIDAFTPVLNPPEAGILGLGQINDRLVRDGDGMAWRKTMVLSLTFDHRVVDGVPAAKFLQTLAHLVAHPEKLLA